jgi:hypothetical protein
MEIQLNFYNPLSEDISQLCPLGFLTEDDPARVWIDDLL